MQRARRLASTVVIAALVLGGLNACRADPAVAAYIGADKITEARVDAVYDDAKAKLAGAVEQAREQAAGNPSAAPLPTGDVDLPIKRADVVTALVGRDVLKALATQRGIRPTQVAPDQVAQGIGVPPDAEYTTVYTELQGYLDGLTQQSKPAQLTEADLRDVYGRLSRGGALQGGASFAEFSTNLGDENRKTLAQSLGVRDEILAQVRKMKATVNPRYGNAELPLVSFRSEQGAPLPLVVLSFDTSSGDEGPVRDLS